VCVFKASLHSALVIQPFNLSGVLLTEIDHLHRGTLLPRSYISHLQPSRAPPEKA
jgi:hypothetical protein